jgi:hypothetical protein
MVNAVFEMDTKCHLSAKFGLFKSNQPKNVRLGYKTHTSVKNPLDRKQIYILFLR